MNVEAPKLLLMAERLGFEPRRQAHHPPTRFRVERFQPLSHLSAKPYLTIYYSISPNQIKACPDHVLLTVFLLSDAAF